MVSRCDIRMCIVNILNHRLQVYWWLGGMLRTGWSKRSLSAAVTNTAQNVRFYIITHGIQYNLQPTAQSHVQCGAVEPSLDTVKFNSSLGCGRQLGFVL